MSSSNRIPILQLILLGLITFSCLITPLLAASLDGPTSERKFASKPNDIKKIRNNIEKQQNDVAEQEPQQQPGFQWGNMAGMALKLLVGGPMSSSSQSDGVNNKADTITQLTNGEFTWTKMISLFMEIVLSLVGGGDNNKIDRTDSEPTPLENIMSTVIAFLTGSQDQNEVNIMARQASELLGFVVSLLDALRTSFSQRSMEARSLGSSDPLADVAIATTTMAKSFLRSYNTDDDLCMQKYLCEANQECVNGASDSGYLFCQIGTYGMCYMMERTTYTPFEIYCDAGRRGRIGEDCSAIFTECNEI